MRILYAPSIKKNIKARFRDYLVIPYIDIILIDFILCEVSEEIYNFELIYMPYKEEKKEYVEKIIELFNKNKRFTYSYFSLNKLLEYSDINDNVVLLTDILKLSVWYSIKTFNFSINFMPVVENINNKNILNLTKITTNIYELKDCLINISMERPNIEFLKEILSSNLI